MYLAKNSSTDPYFNLAAEEYFLDQLDDDLILLWQNDKTVVVGKNQNTMEEINRDFVAQNDIAVVRRLTGGGAVFHDMGNINYTVIQKFEDELFSDYGYFTKPVCEYIQTLGVKAELSGRNDLLIDGMKFCGNAQTRRNGKIMHHGCILFAADVADLSGALTPSKLKIESKSVKSVRSRVTNVASHLAQPMSSAQFFQGLYDYFLSHMEGISQYQWTKKDQLEISKLAKEKYSTWDWNYGASPVFQGGACQRFPFGIVDLRFAVRAGKLEKVKIYGDFFGIKDAAELEERLTHVVYSKEALDEVTKGAFVGDYISGMRSDELVALFLGGELEKK